MAERLSGKVALVTAAGQGIGRAAALAFAREGATVWATDIDETSLATLTGEPGLRTRVLDVTDDAAIGEAARVIGDLDVLFNCAGIVHHGSVLAATAEEWDRGFAVNVRSMFQMTRAFLPGMLRRGSGSIINMSSVASSVRGLANRCVYGATKAAVVGLTKSIAADFVGKGVRCHAVCPATVDTPSFRQRVQAQPDPEAALRDFVARQPMGRLGTVDDVTGLLVFLASDESSFITGNVHSVDGGMTI
ncbi:MAG: SDR family oxidoreductase [Vicinamibacterales bacterium]